MRIQASISAEPNDDETYITVRMSQKEAKALDKSLGEPTSDCGCAVCVVQCAIRRVLASLDK